MSYLIVYFLYLTFTQAIDLVAMCNTNTILENYFWKRSPMLDKRLKVTCPAKQTFLVKSEAQVKKFLLFYRKAMFRSLNVQVFEFLIIPRFT